MPQTITLDDLASPRHTAEARQILAEVAQLPVEISSEAVIAGALEKCDVPLYREADFLRRMDAYIRAVARQPDLSPLGKITLLNYIVNALVQRSRLEALYTAHPEIEQQEIRRPLIIAGLPRSGTTNLLNMIAADPRLRSLRYWESLEPIPSRQTLAGQASDDRQRNCAAQLDTINAVMPRFSSMHDLRVDSIHEEVELQWLDFGSLLCATVADVPEWLDWFLVNRRTQHYRFLKRVLKALQWLRSPEQWVLKSPQHLAFLPQLVETFPDATFVVTHRDPVSVFTSWISMSAYTARMHWQRIDLQRVEAHARRIQDPLLRGLVRDRAVLPPERTRHVYFQDFMANQMPILEQIYELAGIGLDPTARAAIEDYLATHPRGWAGAVRYDLEGQFGIRREDLYRHYAYYLEAFPVQREAENS